MEIHSEQCIDFRRYKYFYNGWIARKDRQTNQSELFYQGKWTPWQFGTDLDLLAHFGDTDVSELSDCERDRMLLQKEMNKKANEGKTI